MVLKSLLKSLDKIEEVKVEMEIKANPNKLKGKLMSDDDKKEMAEKMNQKRVNKNKDGKL